MIHLKKGVRAFVKSKYMDLFGACLVLFISIYNQFHLTYYFQGNVKFNVPFSQQLDLLKQGAFPLGIFSTVGAVFSLLSTRFVGKQNNLGNIIGVFTTINSGTVDYFLGNHSAIITYPLTFIITYFAVVKWNKGEKIRKIDFNYYLINFAGLVLGYLLVYIGTEIFGGRDDLLFFNIVSITFGLSLGANFSSALKYESTFLSWTVYNVVQLIKAFLQLNIANIAKYIFYLINATVTLADWVWNRDMKNTESLAISG